MCPILCCPPNVSQRSEKSFFAEVLSIFQRYQYVPVVLYPESSNDQAQWLGKNLSAEYHASLFLTREFVIVYPAPLLK